MAFFQHLSEGGKVGLIDVWIELVSVAQSVEHWSCKPQVPGSIPGGSGIFSLRTYWLPFLLLNNNNNNNNFLQKTPSGIHYN